MNTLITLVGKDFALMSRSKLGMLVTFCMPLLLVWGISSIYGLNGHDKGPTNIPLLVVNESTDPTASQFVEVLRQVNVFKVITEVPGSPQPLQASDLDTRMEKSDARFALVLPREFTLDEPFMMKAKLVVNSSSQTETQVVTAVLEGTLSASVPSVLAAYFGELGPDESLAETSQRRLAYSLADVYRGNPEEIFNQMRAGDYSFLATLAVPRGGVETDGNTITRRNGPFVQLDIQQNLGTDLKSPQATTLVGGWAMQFLLFAVSGSAAALFAEKNLGIFQRLLSGPVRRSTLLWSKFTYGVCLGAIQLTTLFVAGSFIVGFELVPHLGSLLLVCILAAASCSAFGMLVASLAQSVEAATGISSMLTMVICALGGVWFPISFMPEFVQKLSRLSLVYWTNQGFSQVLWAHASVWEILPTLGVLAAVTAAGMGLAVWRFGRSNIFV